MKQSSSSFKPRLMQDDDQSNQTTNTRMARHTASQSRSIEQETFMDPRGVRQDLLSISDGIFSHFRERGKKLQRVDQPRYSTILGSFSNPPIYVIHDLDSHLTFFQSFQICSLFGRVRIHGYHLPPGTFVSTFNYRTNTPLSIESIPSTTSTSKSFEEIRSVIDDEQLAALALSRVEEKGGDILLLRREPKNDSLFMKTIREHRTFKHWFTEKANVSNGDPWKQLENDLHIRWIESTNQTVIMPREQFVSTADHVLEQWLKKSPGEPPLVVLICGEKDLGKSTFTRYLINRAFNHIDSTCDVSYFDCDIGQCEFSIGGCLSYALLRSPLLGPPCSHIQSDPKPDRLLYYGLVSPQAAPVRYLQYIDKLRKSWNIDRQDVNSKRSMILMNTMGWGTGLGLELLKETICMCSPNIVIQLGESAVSHHDPNKMPDIPLPWLLQQPVFLPYRRTIQMSNVRQEDYDGQLNYEYIKLTSAAIAAAHKTHSDTPKLRPRDHRLLATWSYFFSSNLSRFHLPWSQFVHVSLLDPSAKNFRALPDCLKHSIVALCINDRFDQCRNSARCINGIFHHSDSQDEVLECLGFGWTERFDKQNQTYEIYTPISSLSNINMLVSGAFDLPDEFEYMFKRVAIE